MLGAAPPDATVELGEVDVTTEGDTAEAAVTLSVTDGTGTTETVEQTWQLRRVFDQWRLSEVPDCPNPTG